MSDKKLPQKSSRKRSAMHQQPSTSEMEAKDPAPDSSPSTSHGASGSTEDDVTKTIFGLLDKLDTTDKETFKHRMEENGLWPDTIVNTSKIFSDPIHGNITIHPVCVAVINTPEFQRLRDLKQLGMSHFVYPGATHTRFEHSLGVCYLAGTFVRQLKQNQPELKINNKDILCLELAGLCHDLGHGPYSHVFDNKVVPKLLENDSQLLEKFLQFEKENVSQKKKKAWKHEYVSQQLLDEIYKKPEVQAVFTKYRLGDKDITFIKALVTGKIDNSKTDRGEDKNCLFKTGRGEDKNFLYEIVANDLTGIDVDKWDYIARDCHQLGIRSTFDHSRFMKFARVISVNGQRHICVRDKELINLYDLFTSRYLLHRNAYQHKVTCALDIMVAQALSKASNIVLFGEKTTLSGIIKDLDWKAYTLLTDCILYKIRDHDSPKLKEAKDIIDRIFSRDFFKCVGESPPFKPKESTESNKEKEDRIEREIGDKCLSTNYKIKGVFFVQVVDLDFGKKKENPLEHIHVYSKESPDEVIKQPPEVSTILKPLTFREQMIRVYVSNNDHKAVIKQAFGKWREDDFAKEKAQPTAAPQQAAIAGSPE